MVRVPGCGAGGAVNMESSWSGVSLGLPLDVCRSIKQRGRLRGEREGMSGVYVLSPRLGTMSR